MISNNIHDGSINPQYCQDDIKKLMDKPFVKLIQDLIKEYGKTTRDGITCWADDFSLSDKKLVLAHYESDLDFLEETFQSETATEALWDEYKKNIQEMVSENTNAVYCDFMEGCGRRMVRHPNHDEVYWI